MCLLSPCELGLVVIMKLSLISSSTYCKNQAIASFIQGCTSGTDWGTRCGSDGEFDIGPLPFSAQLGSLPSPKLNDYTKVKKSITSKYFKNYAFGQTQNCKTTNDKWGGAGVLRNRQNIVEFQDTTRSIGMV